METHVETGAAPDGDAVEIGLLGPLTVRRAGTAVALPASRKARALLGFLALAPHPVPRSRLCELLWDVPDDPRGELRWCLSRVRGVLGADRIEAQGDAVRLDLAGCRVDAAEVEEALRAGPGTLATDRLRELLALFAGDFLEGLELGRLPEFEGWLVAQRRHFRDGRTALLEALAGRLGDEEAADILDAWLRLAPFELRAHGAVLAALARRGRIREGEEHVAVAIHLFKADGLDTAPLRELWRSARAEEALRAPTVPAAAAPPPAAEGNPAGPQRRSVAVMPFANLAEEPRPHGGGPADALVYDLIARLAKLRSLFVIGQGSVFALRDRGVAPAEAGRLLGVDYVVSGSVQLRGKRLAVAVELAEARSARVVWAEVFDGEAEDTFQVLDGIGDRAVALIAGEIEAAERNRAVLRPPDSLDAWEAHHRGLWHMYRFNRADNERARHFFEAAIRLDPTFSRAHAGLSFTHWQNAFQGWAEREGEVERAYAAAAQGLMADERDPAAHWAMGRALWLRGRHDPSVEELERAVELSPNFALGHYTLAFVHSLTGDPATAVAASEQSLRLSPHDPMLFGMLGARAMALVRLGRFEEAAEAGVRAAARPNAHAHILAIAAVSLALAGRLDEARAHVAAIRSALPRYRVDDLVAAMQPTPEGERLFRKGARRIGLG
ncbi:BTAD domain-containing putative transcriptional regulator [Paracraurococcus ruber]|uniref:Transcriptional regulator n=1 Tax=Paracraurococcus ruber TaxID=77675 RepID=A0ABS1D3E2_9PROT|nr:BTAD domain-containing putative transcriptional regulator [Paracraurococcus ruber]MBK1661130.1 transcriptional regulator [Paracraurococcus ruber]TDG26988.1 tetratricopeptide repeat protein [Paracraurococcus ruber]